jgi:hypothetical protein
MLPHHHQVELAVTVSIVAGSALLFVYWFRYTCLLILSAKTACDYTRDVAAANQLSFLDVQSRLREGSFADLDPLHAALERDHSVITYLLKNAAHSGAEESSLETQMLEMYYRLMGAWYRASKPFSAQAACRALEQMSSVVEHFANVMGERAAFASSAA